MRQSLASDKRSFPDPYNGLWDSIDAAFPLGAVEQLRPVLIKDYTLLRGKPFVSGLKCDRDIFLTSEYLGKKLWGVRLCYLRSIQSPCSMCYNRLMPAPGAQEIHPFQIVREEFCFCTCGNDTAAPQ